MFCIWHIWICWPSVNAVCIVIQYILYLFAWNKLNVKHIENFCLYNDKISKDEEFRGDAINVK